MSKFKIGDKIQTTEHWAKDHHGLVTEVGLGYSGRELVTATWYRNNGETYEAAYLADYLKLLERKEPTMNQQVPFTVTGNLISLFIDGKPYFVQRGDGSYEELREHLKGPHDLEVIRDLVDKKAYVQKITEGMVTVEENQVLYKGQPIHNVLSEKLLAMLSEGFDVRPWARFMDNLQKNPSYRSREQLFGFLERWSAPITEDGCFLAFKYVRSDFKDAHTGTMDNSPGKIVQMPREEVDDDPNRTCSAGLHACASRYLSGYAWSNRVVVVKIDPKDVVSIPTDYDFSKMRVCRYEVLREVTQEEVTKVEQQTAVTDWGFLDDYAEESEEDYYYDSYDDSYSY